MLPSQHGQSGHYLFQFLTLDDMKEQKNIGIKNDSDDIEKVMC